MEGRLYDNVKALTKLWRLQGARSVRIKLICNLISVAFQAIVLSTVVVVWAD